MNSEFPRFRRKITICNPGLTETYCQVCRQFLGAGRSDAHLRLLESAHLNFCRIVREVKSQDIKDKCG